MTPREPPVETPSSILAVAHLFHTHLIWFLLGAYGLAVLFPAFGLWIRDTSLGEVTVFHLYSKVSLLSLMLATLLFNAGLGLQRAQLQHVLRHKLVLVLGVTANVLIPIVFIVAVTHVIRVWEEPDEVQDILVGLALVASVPIAGSSTAWAQNANGNLALSLGFVLCSTVLSPLVTPLVLHLMGWMAFGMYATALHNLATYETGTFLGLWVVLPSVLGFFARPLLGERRLSAITPYLKVSNAITLLLLNYSNASVSLPQTLVDPDFSFLILNLLIAFGLCVLAFASAYGLGRALHIDRPQQVSLMYGIGMNNNGTGLVLGALALSRYPGAMLPIIFYTLVQHVVAGVIHLRMSKP